MSRRNFGANNYLARIAPFLPRLAGYAGLVVAAITLLYATGSLPSEFSRLQAVCTVPNCAPGALTGAGLRDLEALGLSPLYFAGYALVLKALLFIVCAVIAGAVFTRLSGGGMPLFVALLLLLFGGLMISPDGAAAGASPAWQLLATLVSFLANTALVTFFYIFPDGRFVPHGTRLLVFAGIIAQLLVYFLPDAPFSRWLWNSSLVVSTIFLLGSLIAQVYRYRRLSDAVQRSQTKWVLFGIAIAIVGTRGAEIVMPLLAGGLLLSLGSRAIYYAALLCVPLSVGFAILRYRIWDIDILINRALVYVALSALVAGSYVLAVAILGSLLGGSGDMLAALIATGTVAVLFQPLRERVQRAANRMVFGERDDPYLILARLHGRLQETLAPEAVLPTIVETIAQALKLPYAAVAIKRAGIYIDGATYGNASGELIEFPLNYRSEAVGKLMLAPRSPGERLGVADYRVLTDLAQQVGVAVQALRLAAEREQLLADLQRSREGIVVAREEERRRLRRDLHDGLGPQLASQALMLSAARKLLQQDLAAADALLLQATTHVQDAVADIRRLVYDLRPPALDDLGLVGALREQVAQYRAAGFLVTLEAPLREMSLPAAVEVAAYRIAQEALTNVIKHAQTLNCTIRLRLGDDLTLQISDDGIGLPDEWLGGVGLRSMHERAGELGGSLTVERATGGGTVVHACLPIGVGAARGE